MPMLLRPFVVPLAKQSVACRRAEKENGTMRRHLHSQRTAQPFSAARLPASPTRFNDLDLRIRERDQRPGHLRPCRLQREHGEAVSGPTVTVLQVAEPWSAIRKLLLSTQWKNEALSNRQHRTISSGKRTGDQHSFWIDSQLRHYRQSVIRG